MRWAAACVVAGCWRGGEPSPVTPPATAPSLVMAIASENQISVIELVGSTLRTTSSRVTPEHVEELFWVGTPAHDAIVYADAAAIYVLDGNGFVPRAIPWPPRPAQPPDTVPVDERSFELFDAGARLFVKKCWFLVPEYESAPTCVASTYAEVYPTVAIRSTGGSDPLLSTDFRQHVVLPKVPQHPARVSYESGDNSATCLDGAPHVLDPTSTEPPVVETIVVDPPIVRLETFWYGAVVGGNAYAIFEGCTASERFTRAVPAANGLVVLVGKDLAIVKNGKIIASASDVNARLFAFRPVPSGGT